MDTDSLKSKLNELVKNETAREVLTGFSIRKRHRQRTSLSKLYGHLIRLGSKIIPDDFQMLFNELESMGFGHRIKDNKFEWYYNIKDVGNYALGKSDSLHRLVPSSKVKTIKNRVIYRPSSIDPPAKLRLVLMVTTSGGDEIPFSLEEIEKITTQVKSFKSKLA